MRAILVAIAILLSGCVGDTAPPGEGLDVTAGTGGIRGVVVDDAIRPVPGAEVKLNTGEAATSDQDGRFSFTGLDPGEYFVVARLPGYAAGQASTTVVAGVADPPSVRILMVFLPDRQPSVTTVVMKGFYECAMGSSVVTDSCDWPYRTAHDTASNETGVPLPLPRSVQNFHNTLEMEVPAGTRSIVQEAQWDDPQVTAMKVSLDATPIDPVCDCSDSFLEVDSGSPTYGRLDGRQVPEGQTVAARGFLPFGDPQVAVNLEFSVYTTFFVHVDAPEGWSFVDGSPLPA